MPPAVAAVAAVGSAIAGAASAVGGAIASAAGFASFGALASSVATNVIVGTGISFALSALSGKPKTPTIPDLSTEAAERTRLLRSSVANRRVIYGTAVVSGPLVFAATTDKGAEKDRYLHLVIPLAGHEVNSVTTFWFNDIAIPESDRNLSTEDITGGDYSGVGRIKIHSGTSTQSSDGNLTSEVGVWSSNHRLRGIAYAYCRLEWDQDIYQNGIPNIKALVQGRKVYDPRSSTTYFSNNPALCIRDYLTASFGLNASSSEIDDSSFIAAANTCDENVNLKAGGTQKRYTCDGVIDLGKKPIDIIEDMLTSCGGVLTYEQGKYKLFVASSTTLSKSITVNDLRAPIKVRTKPNRKDLFNAVRGVFIDPSEDYQPTDFPMRTNAAYEAEDNNEQIFRDITLPFTTDSIRAQRIAEIILQRSRQAITVELPGKLNLLDISVWDVIDLSIDKLGWTNKEFRVLSWSLSEDGGVDLVLQEEADVYSWTPGTDEITIDPAPNTNLPSAFSVDAPEGLILSDSLITLNNGEIATRLDISVIPSNTSFVLRHEVQYKKLTEATWRTIGFSNDTNFEVLGVLDSNTYDVRARGINARGVRSSWTTKSYQIIGKTAPPEDVSNFSMNIIDTECHLTWAPISDLDLNYYWIRFSSLTDGATFNNGVDIVPRVAKPATSVTVPAQTGTYMIKAVDTSGISSQNATMIASIFDSVKGLNAIQIETEDPNFNGSKSNVVAVDNSLILDTSLNFDDMTGNFDDALGLFDSGQGSVVSSGTYDFENIVDLTAVYTSRVTATLTVQTLDYVNSFDAALGNFDDREGLFDGDTNTAALTNVRLQISTTEDDPAGSPTWSAYRDFIVGEYRARALRFRAILETKDSNQTPKISALSVSVDMPDRTEAAGDIASTTNPSGKSITFSPAFKSVKGLAIAAQNLAQGDYYQITNKTNSGFMITFYNSSSSIVDRTFDYQALGYGHLVT